MKSTNIKDYADIGCNADWCTSAYQLDNEHIIFDTETEGDNGYIYELCYIWEADQNFDEGLSAMVSGPFEECVDYFNEMKKQEMKNV